MITGAVVLESLRNGTEKIVLVAAIFLVTILVRRMVNTFLTKSFKKSSKVLHVDETNFKFFRHLASACIYLIGIGVAIYMIPSLRTLSVSLFAGAGILAVIIGFASQHAFSNIVSGVFITIFKPFRVGDRVKVGPDLRGIVEDINLRHTVIKDFENKRIIIPNTLISSQVIENSSINDERICRQVDFSIGYDSNLDLAMKIMIEEALKHPNHIDVRSAEEIVQNEPMVRVRVIGFGDSDVKLRAWVWAKDSASAFALGCDLNKSIKERFDRAGIEMPYPYRTIVYKKDPEKEAKKKPQKSSGKAGKV